MPICSAAKKLSEELNTQGAAELEKLQERRKSGEKLGKLKQYEILRILGVEPGEIAEFVDPKFWIRYFSDRAFQDIQDMGLLVDRRRSFVTTDYNPYYDKFIQW